ncbi:ATPase synthesis protein 25 mitochondrial [Ascosphaera acerosa]|nr:ATPase synthesis protein 25 mitochondrial [Ascosphaera acerosa]
MHSTYLDTRFVDIGGLESVDDWALAGVETSHRLARHVAVAEGSSEIKSVGCDGESSYQTAHDNLAVAGDLAPAPGREQQRASVFEEHAVPVPRAAFKAVLARQSRVRKIMRVAFAEFGAAEFPALLRMHFFQAQFDLFWDIWRRRALMRVPRGKAEYLVLFRVMAERANEKLIMQMLDEAVPMMEREAVPVRLDAELAQALMRCLVVVEPGVRGRLHADGLTPAHGPVFALWDRCMRAVLEGQDAAQQESQTVR